MLFDFFFKIFFIFRSFYLCVIDFRFIFNFELNLSFVWNCISKQFDSSKKFLAKTMRRSRTKFSFFTTICFKTFESTTHFETFFSSYNSTFRRKNRISNLNCCRFICRYWGNFDWFFVFCLLIYSNSTSIFARFEVNLR